PPPRRGSSRSTAIRVLDGSHPTSYMLSRMRESGSVWRIVLALTLAGSTGCATAGGGAAPMSSAGLQPAEATLAASLLRAEDEGVFDAAAFEAAVVAPNPELRARAALAIGRIGDDAGAAMLRGLLADPDTSVAASAAFALGLLRDSLAAPVLAPLLQPDSARRKPTLAIEAAEALGRIGTAEASAALTGFLENADIRDGGLQRVAGSVLIGASRTDSVPPVAIARW